MNRKILPIIFLLLLFAGCKTTKYNVKETAKTSLELQTDTKEDIKILEETKVSDKITQLVDELTTIVERITTTKLSAPDSTGYQYPTEVTNLEREYSKGKTVKSEMNNTTEQTTNINAQKTDNSVLTGKSEVEKVDKTTVKKTTPAWVVVSVVVFGFGLLFLLYLLLKRYKK